MENYFKEIVEICGLPFNEVLKDVKIILIGGKALYVSNYKKIVTYSKESIDLRVKGDIIHISGENMLVKQLDKNEIIISGKICGVMVGDYARK